MTRIAAIDFGTNTARLLIADVAADGRFSHVKLERRIVRMGGGFTRETGLSDDAIARGLACLEQFAEIIKSHDVAVVRAVATSAVRDALNGPRFVADVSEKTGISLRVIDGEVEGFVTLAGVVAGLDKPYNNILLFDVGGGSTEYTIASGGMPCFTSSLPIGVVRLVEGKVEPEAMQTKIKKELDIVLAEMASKGVSVENDAILVGTAGTATTLAAIDLEMHDYDYRRVNNAVLSKERIAGIYKRLLPLSSEERLIIPGLEKGREDLIIAGCLITLITMEVFGFDQLKVSDYGLLEGLIISDLVN